MSVYITFDAGSCHSPDGKNPNKDMALSLIDVAKDAGADAIKFQLDVRAPNVDLPFEWWPALCLYAERVGIDLYASCFSTSMMNRYISEHTGPKMIKFAYSQRNDKWQIKMAKDAGFSTVVSCDHMTAKGLEGFADVKLFCIPQYPLYFHPEFLGCFSVMDGFSDHGWGVGYSACAVAFGAQYIEKHLKLPESVCPDANFALESRLAKQFVDEIRVNESKA